MFIISAGLSLLELIVIDDHGSVPLLIEMTTQRSSTCWCGHKVKTQASHAAVGSDRERVAD